MHTATHPVPMRIPPVLTEIAAASLAAATESVAPCPPLWRCGPCDYSTASAAEYTRHCSKGEHAATIARARIAEFMARETNPRPTARDGWQMGGRYDVAASAAGEQARRFFAELRAHRLAGDTYTIHTLDCGALQIEFRRVARPRPVPPDVGDAAHEWAEAADDAADARAAHLTAERVGGA